MIMNNHKNRWIRYVTAFVLAACLMVLWKTSAEAAAADKAKAEITVSQIFEVKNGDKTKPEDEFKYEFKTLEQGNPMPDGTDKNGTYQFKINGEDDIKISMEYTHAGVYKYELKPVINQKEKGYSYDEAEYTVTVHVKNEQSGLAAAVVVKNEKQNKVAKIVYSNGFEYEETATDNTNQSSGNNSQNNQSNQNNVNAGQNNINGSSPKTGDSSFTAVYMAACCISFMGVLRMAAARRKKDEY